MLRARGLRGWYRKQSTAAVGCSGEEDIHPSQTQKALATGKSYVDCLTDALCGCAASVTKGD